MNNSTNLGQTMRAWAISAYGELLELREMPLPRPSPDDVLMRMHGAELGDWDELVRTGKWPMERPFPLILGLAGAGVVASVGKNVDRFRENDPVFAYSYPLHDNGAWAEYMLVPQSYAATPPPALALDHAGTVPIAGLTVHETLVDILDVRNGDVVLITAASGGVGHLAVQLAKHLGALVVATTSGQHAEFVAALGADTVIDYTAGDVAEAIRASYPQGISKALNGVSNEAANAYVSVLAAGGHIVDLPGAITAQRPDVRIDRDYVVRGDGARLQTVSDLIDAGVLRVEIREVFPFDCAPAALDKVLTKHVIGKVALGIR